MTAAAVAANVNGGTITSSPGPTPAARYARWSAAVQLETATAWRPPTYSANTSSNAAVRGPMVSQPERRVSATAWRSSSSTRRSKNGISGNVSVAAVIGIRERAGGEGISHLADAVGDGHRSLEAKHLAHLVEADLVVARVVVLANVAHLAGVELALDRLDDVELAVVLAGAADVEHLVAYLLDWRVERGAHGPGSVAHMHVRAPELLAEDLELLVGPEVAGELVDGEIEAHARGHT